MQFKLFRIFLYVLTMLSFSHLAQATPPLVEIKNATMPKLPPVSRTAAIYMTVENKGDKELEIVGVETDVAHHTMIHKTVEKDGMAKMEHLDSIRIPAKGNLELKPGSYHIMLMGLDKEKLAKPFELSLLFAKHSPMKIQITPEK